MLTTVRTGLVASYNATVVDELLAAYVEAKGNYYLGRLRLSEVEGGRFCEAAFRLLEERTTGTFTPLGTSLRTDGIIRTLANLSSGSQPDSIRLHIPRALRVVYDIRNNRDAAHLADGIDPNLQDSSLVIGILDWVLAEFVRLHHNVPANEAHDIIDGIVSRRAPVVQEFGTFLKVLKTTLQVSDRIRVLLYQRGSQGATLAELNTWVHPRMRSNLKATLRRLEDDHAHIHFDQSRYFITRAGIRHVEANRLHQP